MDGEDDGVQDSVFSAIIEEFGELFVFDWGGGKGCPLLEPSDANLFDMRWFWRS